MSYDNKTGRPLNCTSMKGGWATNYFTFAIAESFEQLYTNRLHYFARFWGKVKNIFKF